MYKKNKFTAEPTVKEQKFLSTCDPELAPIVASRLNGSTPRRAIDSSGELGSFYDASTDKVINNVRMNFNLKSAESQKSPQCYMKLCKTDETPNLLEWFNMHHELRLNILLEIIPPMGMGKLINYRQPIDKYTRFICYKYYSSTDYVSDKEFKSSNRNRTPIQDTSATHVIVLVNWGIDATVVLQLPPDDELAEIIDGVLKKLCSFLSETLDSSNLTENDENILKKILHTNVFSNISNLAEVNSVIDFSKEIQQLKTNSKHHTPYTYNLCPIQYFYSTNIGNRSVFNEIGENLVQNIEQYLFPFSLDLSRLKFEIEENFPNLEKHPNQQFDNMKNQLRNFEKMYYDEMERIRNLVERIRRGESDLEQELINNEIDKLNNSIQDLIDLINLLKEKENLIKYLLEKNFQYENVANSGLKNINENNFHQDKIFHDSNTERIICFDDDLYERNRIEWDAMCRKLSKEREKNSQLRIIFADFTYFPYKVKDLNISTPFVKTNNQEEQGEEKLKFSSKIRSQSSKHDNCINVLLIGESDVGKSTFINALANYLNFNTFKRAQSSKPVVLIPGSFLMTYDDDFKERRINFGEQDDSNNENYEHLRQSVTQHCKSYIFTIQDEDHHGTKIRIIDTPGIGYSNNFGENDSNMEQILSYICNLTHLHTICFLLKPNNTKSNQLFRSCFTQLFDLLGEKIRKKFIFCFTNSRTTFYSPGSTVSLLKDIFKSLAVKKVPFTRENTFCFDNEAFRYLVANHNGITFNASDEGEFKESWNRSSNESKRFLMYIHNTMIETLIPDQWKTNKHAQIRIHLMIRPILETMRNILRHIILSNVGLRKVSIELCPKTIKSPTAICLECKHGSLQIGDFWITTDFLHVFQNKCQSCSCLPEKHIQINYELQYKPCNYPPNYSYNYMAKTLDDLCETSAQFGHFLFGKTSENFQNDLFLIGLKRMIKEENDICSNQDPCQLNSCLISFLEELTKNYEETRKKLMVKHDHITLSFIYDKTEDIMKYEMIRTQMAAVEQGEKSMMKFYESEVKIF